MKTLIHPNDIPVLARIFNPKVDLIFVILPVQKRADYQAIPDSLGCQIRWFTNQRMMELALEEVSNKVGTIINLDPNGLDVTLIAKHPQLVLIDACRRKGASNLFGTQKFDFINNTEGTIRWIYNHENRRPIFLNLYNNTSWKGGLFRGIMNTGFKLGLKNWLKTGSIWITANELFLNDRQNGQCAIFTGTTIGANRKAVISFEQGEKATKFLKMPLSKAANQLVTNELAYLQELKGYKFRKIVIPKPKRVGEYLMVTNISPEQKINNKDLKGMHLAALNELYSATIRTTLLSQSNAWRGIQEDLASLENTPILNNLSKEKVGHLRTLLSKLELQLADIDFLPMSIAHGDFTPQNCYLTEKAAHIYNWELAERLPLFYDAFHYIFQSSILIKKLPFSAIEKQIAAFAKIPIVEKMIAEFGIDYEQTYQFYLLRNISYYLSRYVQQSHLQMQAHLLVDIWIEALQALKIQSKQQGEMHIWKK